MNKGINAEELQKITVLEHRILLLGPTKAFVVSRL
jgi:hypothetical protein